MTLSDYRALIRTAQGHRSRGEVYIAELIEYITEQARINKKNYENNTTNNGRRCKCGSYGNDNQESAIQGDGGSAGI